jgi:hypothetical protein
MQPTLLALEDRKLLSGFGTQAVTQSITGLQRLVSLSGTASFPTENAGGVPSTGGGASSLTPTQGFDGLNGYQQRFANGGNQFSVEPPDEGLAVGNGYVVNAVNCVIRVYDTSGTPLTDVVDANTFFGYPAQINRTTGERGPELTDPSVYFDQPTQRWFVDLLTIEVNPATGQFTGPNHLDIAVSQTADPTGSWNIYSLPVQDDGTQGTPNHGDANYSGPFLGDYPHIGADRNGIYLTTNEFRMFGDGAFRGAQVYAFSKAALESGSSSIPVVQFDTAANPAGNPDGLAGFTLIPASTPDAAYAGSQGGTEYLLSTTNVYQSPTGTGNLLEIWALTNTKSLDSGSPNLTLQSSGITVNTFSIPPAADQMTGNYPLGQKLGEPEEVLESLDPRMTQVTYANGKLWGAIDTAVTVGGAIKAGIDWYVINPQVNGHGVSGSIINQGTLALAGNNLLFPAMAVTPSGKGVIGFSVTGSDYYPSAGYATMDARSGAGPIQIAAAGVGPEDGFTGYTPYGGAGQARWGDYSAAAVDGQTVWVASEYIANTGTLDEYLADPTLGGTRAPLINWDNRITPVSTTTGPSSAISASVSNNTVNSLQSAVGGGNSSEYGTLSATGSRAGAIQANRATSTGDGIYALDGAVVFNHSVIDGNMASGSATGDKGGIYPFGGPLSLVKSKAKGNKATTAYDDIFNGP